MRIVTQLDFLKHLFGVDFLLVKFESSLGENSWNSLTVSEIVRITKVSKAKVAFMLDRNVLLTIMVQKTDH